MTGLCRHWKRGIMERGGAPHFLYTVNISLTFATRGVGGGVP